MPTIRIALANVRSPTISDESTGIVIEAITDAAAGGAAVVCFPECIVPGYRIGSAVREPDQPWLDRAWSAIDEKAGALGIGVVIGTERITTDGRLITARVTNPDGTWAGFQDKVQIDPSEEATYTAGTGRRLFQIGELIFGVVICHEGWRYPETVRWAARHGAHVVFHPHFEVVENDRAPPNQFADPANTFHEKAALCRAAENTCYFATVNCALEGSSTTSALIDPAGVLIAYQPYWREGILFGDIQTESATGLLAKRLRPNTLATKMLR